MKRSLLLMSALVALGACAKEPIIPVVYQPPPIPIPAPLPFQYVVFFDLGSARVSQQGIEILRLAADDYRRGGAVSIRITGYTDRSGSAQYNQRLSERRAASVARALTNFGVPRGTMSVFGRGENDNRVPTPDGVREPQNRRVEITQG